MYPPSVSRTPEGAIYGGGEHIRCATQNTKGESIFPRHIWGRTICMGSGETPPKKVTFHPISLKDVYLFIYKKNIDFFLNKKYVVSSRCSVWGKRKPNFQMLKCQLQVHNHVQRNRTTRKTIPNNAHGLGSRVWCLRLKEHATTSMPPSPPLIWPPTGVT